MCFAVTLLLLLLVCSPGGDCSTSEGETTVNLPVVNQTGIRFTHLSSGEEPSHSRVGFIVQDDQGFLWLGTNNGLERYDGYSIRTFEHEPGNPNTLSGSNINALFKDRSGKLWVGSDSFLDSYDPVTETFTHYRYDPSIFQGYVTTFSQDREGILWVGTVHGLNRLDPASGRTVRFQHRADDPSTLTSDIVQGTLETRDGTFWVATPIDLEVFDRQSGKITRRLPLKQFGTPAPLGQLTVGLHEDRFGVLWVTSRAGLASVDRRNYKLTYYASKRDGKETIALTGVRAIQEDRDGTLWLGAADNGIFKLDRNRKQFVAYRNNPYDPHSLSTNQVVALCEDREGNMWVGTTGGGVDRFASRPLPFQRYRHEAWNPQSLPTDYTSSVYEDSHGELWVGSIEALTKIDRKTGRFTFYTNSQRAGEISSPWVLSAVEDRAGYLWFGTMGNGLNRLDRRSGRFTTFRHNPADIHSLSEDSVYALYVDRSGTLWASTGDGLDAYDAKTESFRTYRVPGEGPVRYKDIAPDAAGALWLGTWEAGLRRLDPATGKFTVYRAGKGRLSSDQVNGLCVDHSGIVWAGTQNGLDRLDPATGKINVYYTRDGLPSNTISSILSDGTGNLWISTSHGLSRFDPTAGTFKTYYAADGLAGNEFYNYANGYKSAAGEMFFNNYAGVTAFYPDKVRDADTPYTPPVELTDFQLFSEPVPIGSGSPLKQPINFTRSVVLSHEQNIFSFDFAALSYSDPQRNRYRYRLEGLDKAWNEADSHHRFVTYTTLPPGQYVFRVQGRTNRGPWNEAGASLRIRILPPWWSTWWFRMAASALIFLLLGTMYELRLRQIAAEFNMRLEERVGERTRIARELHDTLLQSFQGLMLLFQRAHNLLPGRPREALAALDDALVRADHAIQEGRDAVYELRASTVLRNDLAQAMTELGQELGRLDERAATAKFRVLVEGTPRNLHPILRDEIYCIAREALRNAFHHAKAHQIEADLTYAAPLLRLRVRDDGIGIDPQILGQGSREGHYGLPGMHERARRIGAQLNVWSRPGAGTEVELCIPAPVAYRNPGHAVSRFLHRKLEHTHER